MRRMTMRAPDRPRSTKLPVLALLALLGAGACRLSPAPVSALEVATQSPVENVVLLEIDGLDGATLSAYLDEAPRHASAHASPHSSPLGRAMGVTTSGGSRATYAAARAGEAVTVLPSLSEPASATLVTGVAPVRHEVRADGQPLAAATPTLFEVLARHGAESAAAGLNASRGATFIAPGADDSERTTALTDWLSTRTRPPRLVAVRFNGLARALAAGGVAEAYDALARIDRLIAPLLYGAGHALGPSSLLILTSGHGMVPLPPGAPQESVHRSTLDPVSSAAHVQDPAFQIRSALDVSPQGLGLDPAHARSLGGVMFVEGLSLDAAAALDSTRPIALVAQRTAEGVTIFDPELGAFRAPSALEAALPDLARRLAGALRVGEIAAFADRAAAFDLRPEGAPRPASSAGGAGAAESIVPLVFAGPLVAGWSREPLARMPLEDVAPTVLGLLGVAPSDLAAGAGTNHSVAVMRAVPAPVDANLEACASAVRGALARVADGRDHLPDVDPSCRPAIADARDRRNAARALALVAALAEREPAIYDAAAVASARDVARWLSATAAGEATVEANAAAPRSAGASQATSSSAAATQAPRVGCDGTGDLLLLGDVGRGSRGAGETWPGARSCGLPFPLRLGAAFNAAAAVAVTRFAGARLSVWSGSHDPRELTIALLTPSLSAWLGPPALVDLLPASTAAEAAPVLAAYRQLGLALDAFSAGLLARSNTLLATAGALGPRARPWRAAFFVTEVDGLTGDANPTVSSVERARGVRGSESNAGADADDANADDAADADADGRWAVVVAELITAARLGKLDGGIDGSWSGARGELVAAARIWLDERNRLEKPCQASLPATAIRRLDGAAATLARLGNAGLAARVHMLRLTGPPSTDRQAAETASRIVALLDEHDAGWEREPLLSWLLWHLQTRASNESFTVQRTTDASGATLTRSGSTGATDALFTDERRAASRRLLLQIQAQLVAESEDGAPDWARRSLELVVKLARQSEFVSPSELRRTLHRGGAGLTPPAGAVRTRLVELLLGEYGVNVWFESLTAPAFLRAELGHLETALGVLFDAPTGPAGSSLSDEQRVAYAVRQLLRAWATYLDHAASRERSLGLLGVPKLLDDADATLLGHDVVEMRARALANGAAPGLAAWAPQVRLVELGARFVVALVEKDTSLARRSGLELVELARRFARFELGRRQLEVAAGPSVDALARAALPVLDLVAALPGAALLEHESLLGAPGPNEHREADGALRAAARALAELDLTPGKGADVDRALISVEVGLRDVVWLCDAWLHGQAAHKRFHADAQAKLGLVKWRTDDVASVGDLLLLAVPAAEQALLAAPEVAASYRRQPQSLDWVTTLLAASDAITQNPILRAFREQLVAIVEPQYVESRRLAAISEGRLENLMIDLGIAYVDPRHDEPAGRTRGAAAAKASALTTNPLGAPALVARGTKVMERRFAVIAERLGSRRQGSQAMDLIALELGMSAVKGERWSEALSWSERGREAAIGTQWERLPFLWDLLGYGALVKLHRAPEAKAALDEAAARCPSLAWTWEPARATLAADAHHLDEARLALDRFLVGGRLNLSANVAARIKLESAGKFQLRFETRVPLSRLALGDGLGNTVVGATWRAMVDPIDETAFTVDTQRRMAPVETAARSRLLVAWYALLAGDDAAADRAIAELASVSNGLDPARLVEGLAPAADLIAHAPPTRFFSDVRPLFWVATLAALRGHFWRAEQLFHFALTESASTASIDEDEGGSELCDEAPTTRAGQRLTASPPWPATAPPFLRELLDCKVPRLLTATGGARSIRPLIELMRLQARAMTHDLDAAFPGVSPAEWTSALTAARAAAPTAIPAWAIEVGRPIVGDREERAFPAAAIGPAALRRAITSGLDDARLAAAQGFTCEAALAASNAAPPSEVLQLLAGCPPTTRTAGLLALAAQADTNDEAALDEARRALELAGRLPLFDGRDVAAIWSITRGVLHRYQASHPRQFPAAARAIVRMIPDSSAEILIWLRAAAYAGDLLLGGEGGTLGESAEAILVDAQRAGVTLPSTRFLKQVVFRPANTSPAALARAFLDAD